MNYLYSICNGCDNATEKESLLYFNKKDSLLSNNFEIPNEELISIDSTFNNFVIIDYPYDQLSSNSKDLGRYHCNYKLKNKNNLKNKYDRRIYNHEILDKNFNLKNSINSSSSEIINNEDSISHNKALLLNYYSKKQNLKNNSKKNKIIKINDIKEIENNIKKGNETNKKNTGNKSKNIKLKIEISYPDSHSYISNVSNKPKNLLRIRKNLSIKDSNINLKKYKHLQNSKTNYNIFKNCKIKNIMKNKNTIKNKDINLELQKSFKIRSHNISKIYPYQNINKKSHNKIFKNKLININKKNNYKIKEKINRIFPKNKNSKNKINNSYIDNSDMILNNLKNNKSTLSNTISCYANKKNNKINFSYLWLNNKSNDSEITSKTIRNSFDKFQTKNKNRKILNCITKINKLKKD